MSLNITLSIGQVESELCTDEPLSFDAIESILNRNVQALLVMFNSLSEDDRLYALGLDAAEDDEAYEDTDEGWSATLSEMRSHIAYRIIRVGKQENK